jgi:insertion element IS1 protein InsB
VEFFVGSKKKQRSLWHAIDHAIGAVLAYVLAPHHDQALVKLVNLLKPSGIKRFFTDDWSAYERILDPNTHLIGKKNTQKIESKHLTLRTRIKRLDRKTICISKSIVMRDIVIGLFINKYEFSFQGVAHIHNGGQTFKFKILTQQLFQDKFYVYLPSIIMNMCNASFQSH